MDKLFYLLILGGYIFSWGNYSLPGVIILLTVVVALFVYLFVFKSNLNVTLSDKVFLVILTLLSLVLYGGLYQQDKALVFGSYILLGINFSLAVLALFRKNVFPKKIFLLMLILAVLLRLFVVWSVPDPQIDVFEFLKNGALGLLTGQNPYSLVYRKLYTNIIPDYYSYLPGMVILTTPFVALFGDPRYTFVLTEVALALVAFKLLWGDNDKRYIFPLLVLSNPMSLLLIGKSYTESLVLLLVVLAAYFFWTGWKLLAAVSFGIALATKQYVVFLLPLFLRTMELNSARMKFLMLSGLTVMVLVVPFYVWSPADFIHDVYSLYLFTLPRYDGLTFFSFLYRFGWSYNLILSAILIFPVALFIYAQKGLSLAKFFFFGAYLLLVFFVFNKWSFVNYYYFVSQLFLFGIIFATLKRGLKTNQG